MKQKGLETVRVTADKAIIRKGMIARVKNVDGLWLILATRAHNSAVFHLVQMMTLWLKPGEFETV